MIAIFQRNLDLIRHLLSTIYLKAVGYISTVAAPITCGQTPESMTVMNAAICNSGISVIAHIIPHEPGTTKAATISKHVESKFIFL